MGDDARVSKALAPQGRLRVPAPGIVTLQHDGGKLMKVSIFTRNGSITAEVDDVKALLMSEDRFQTFTVQEDGREYVVHVRTDDIRQIAEIEE